MTYTVLHAPESLRAQGYTHIVAYTEGRGVLAAFINNDLASKFSDTMNGIEPPKAPEPPKPPEPPRPPEVKTIGVADGLSLQQKVEAARAGS